MIIKILALEGCQHCGSVANTTLNTVQVIAIVVAKKFQSAFEHII
jgi:hypothetical protein